MPFFSLVRQRRRRARRLSVVRAVAAGWARLGDKSLFHQMVAQCQPQARGARRSQLSIRRDWWDLGSMFRRPRSKTARASVVGMLPRRVGQGRFVPLSGPMDRGP
jgi:hypothetical protein